MRKPMVWKDPATDKKHRLWIIPEFVDLLENVIEIEEQAEDFMAKYVRYSAYADENVGYFISLIKDEDIREDALDLFNLTIPEPENAMHFLFGPDEVPWGSCMGFKIRDGKRWTNEGVKEYVGKKSG